MADPKNNGREKRRTEQEVIQQLFPKRAYRHHTHSQAVMSKQSKGSTKQTRGERGRTEDAPGIAPTRTQAKNGWVGGASNERGTRNGVGTSVEGGVGELQGPGVPAGYL